MCPRCKESQQGLYNILYSQKRTRILTQENKGRYLVADHIIMSYSA